MKNEKDLRLVTYCGLYCGACSQRVNVPKQARALMRTLHEEGFDDFYQYAPNMKNDFPVFWRFLGSLTEFDCSCRDDKGGPPDCSMRKCARARSMTVCSECPDYPCDKMTALGECYPILIPDGRRMQKIGLEKWIEEQQERADRGFTYADIRYK